MRKMKPKFTLIASMLGLSIMLIHMTGCMQKKSKESDEISESGKPNILLIVADD